MKSMTFFLGQTSSKNTSWTGETETLVFRRILFAHVVEYQRQVPNQLGRLEHFGIFGVQERRGDSERSCRQLHKVYKSPKMRFQEHLLASYGRVIPSVPDRPVTSCVVLRDLLLAV